VHLLNQQIKDMMHVLATGNPEAHTSTLKVIPGFTSFLENPESIAKVKVASNVQRCNPPPLFFSVNNY